MKKLMLLGVAATAAMVFTGCASLEVSSGNDLSGEKLAPNGQTLGHITASNSGFYFLNFPLMSGSTANPGSMVFTEDTVNPQSVVKMVTEKAKGMGATGTYDMWSQADSMMIPIPFPFLFYMRSVNVSANAVK